MSTSTRTVLVSGPGLVLLFMLLAPLRADESDAPVAATTSPVATENTGQIQQTLAERVLKSLVVVRATDRGGDESGFGAGFAVDQPGLIATARHVIGDGRDFVVELPNGKVAPVIEVFASSSQLDLVIVKIDDTSLQPLPLSVHPLKEQQSLIAMGHPRGKHNQMASGVYSGPHTIEGIEMLELAMPIEPGNSGGPVLTNDGNVVGLVTMKSTAEDKIGYALSSMLIRQLIDEPNPVPMARWKTIGALDPKVWTPVFGAEWKQHSAKILVNGTGQSFGGRTLCVRQTPVPEYPFDLRVDVKLGDEQGAAGLIFHSDGADRHYGFYPSAGNMRLTRFDGPDVGSWTILHNEPHPAYQPLEWNTLIVRIHADHFECFLNGQKVVESHDDVIPHGEVGLAAFRGTPAQFRRFQTGANLLPTPLDQDAQRAVNDAIDRIVPSHSAGSDAVRQLLPFGEQAETALSAEASRLEKHAQRLRQLAKEVHESTIRKQLADVLGLAKLSDAVGSAESTDDARVETGSGQDPGTAADNALLRAALLIARMDNADVDVEAYNERVRLMADEIRGELSADADEATRLSALDRYLFEQLGFHGSRFEYYTRANIYLNEVIEDREGLPITLSILYMEIGHQLDLKLEGLGLPGHFVVQYTPADSAAVQIVDPFERGKRLTEEDVADLLAQAPFSNPPRFRVPQTPVQICERMIGNLLGLAEREKDEAAVLRYLETLVMLSPASPEYHAKRLEMRARNGSLTMALEDANWFIDNQVDGVDLERVRTLRTSLESERARQQADEK